MQVKKVLPSSGVRNETQAVGPFPLMLYPRTVMLYSVNLCGTDRFLKLFTSGHSFMMAVLSVPFTACAEIRYPIKIPLRCSMGIGRQFTSMLTLLMMLFIVSCNDTVTFIGGEEGTGESSESTK